MFAIGFEKWDLLLIRFKQGSNDNLEIGYIRYFLREGLQATKFETREEAGKILEIIKNTNVNFVNDSLSKSIVDGTNIDKSKLKIFEIGDKKC